MGQDKALVPFRDGTMIEYILRQLKGFGSDTIVISNSPEDYSFLNLPVYPDIYSGIGALGGLHSAIYHSSSELCFVLACDMPFINLPLLDHIGSLALKTGSDIIIPRLDESEYAEPFRAVYRKTCLEPIEKAIQMGKRRVISFFPDVMILYLEREEIEIYDPELVSFFNVNTPEELHQAAILADRLSK